MVKIIYQIHNKCRNKLSECLKTQLKKYMPCNTILKWYALTFGKQNFEYKKSDYIYEVGPMIEVIKNYIGKGEEL